ncbi:hypothetical protein [Streptomyces sp. OspMP-M43]|uniref:hypothetical protein n=1 Tax=Streptomyces sp. OspMP-M43 TaxID=1839781 RepID=UPI00081B203E|nr:hypothetical protein [Streptomyces sp. OspMP-M43]SCE43102.1 hypothetical protein GA0115261_1053315 [Streptomyces sp. OspMP-M43]
MTRTLTLTTGAFRDRHGDPATWSAAALDSYQVIGDIAPPPPLPFTHREMQAEADAWQASAAGQQRLAEELATEGHTIAAGIHRRGAQDARQHAQAGSAGRTTKRSSTAGDPV